MRILLVSAHYRPHVGGVERFVESLADGLAARGHDVCVVCARTDRDAPRSERGAVRVRRVRSSTWPERRLGVPYPLPEPAALLSTLQQELATADIVHVQDALYLTSVAALGLARRRRVPSVLTQHVPFVPQQRLALELTERAAVAAVGRAARLASRVVAYNADVAAWAERQWGVDRVAVLPVGVPAPEEVGRDEARTRLGIRDERFLALFVGRDVAKKGLDLVLGAADPAYEILAVTDRAGSSPPGTRLMPFVAERQVPQLYAAADAFVLPSVAEGVPFALQEAMAYGLPVVLTYAPGYAPSFSKDDVLPVPRDAAAIRDALRSLAADAGLRERLSARSLAVSAAAFSYDAFVDAYERLYADVLTLKL